MIIKFITTIILISCLGFSNSENLEDIYKKYYLYEDSTFIRSYLKMQYENNINYELDDEINEEMYTYFKINKKFINVNDLDKRQYIIETKFMNGGEFLVTFDRQDFEFHTIFKSPEGELELYHEYKIIDDQIKVYLRNYSDEFYKYDEGDSKRFVDDTLTYKLYNQEYID